MAPETENISSSLTTPQRLQEARYLVTCV